MSQTNAKRQMPSRLVWIDEKRFRGFGCSECAWVFNPSGSPTGRVVDSIFFAFHGLNPSEAPPRDLETAKQFRRDTLHLEISDERLTKRKPRVASWRTTAISSLSQGSHLNLIDRDATQKPEVIEKLRCAQHHAA